MKAMKMNKLLSIAAATLLIAGLSAGSASANHRRHHGMHGHHSMKMHSRMTTRPSMVRGNNAELMGNNGNSGSGNNSLGHIQGGNLGGGK
jgi:hypothetical protein